MNAALPRQTLEDATRLDALSDDPKAIDPKDRRGPFRPEKLVSARERRSGDMFVRLFRGIDFLALVFFAVVCARSVAPHGFFTSPLGNILPFIATTLGLYWALYLSGLYRFGRNARVTIHLVKLALVFGAGYLLADFLADFSINDYAVTAAVRFWMTVTLVYFMLQHLRCSADVPIREMPQDAIRYLKLMDGIVVEAQRFVIKPRVV